MYLCVKLVNLNDNMENEKARPFDSLDANLIGKIFFIVSTVL